MRRAVSFLLAAALIALPVAGADKEKDEDRLRNCGMVMHEILNVPDDIPQSLLDKAECVIVIPSVLKGAFGVGGSYGRGAMTCRSGAEFSGPWGTPTMMALEGASFGFQLGGQATDFVLLVMNDRGASSILSSKVKLGADASAAAGPKGRDAEADTDAYMRAEVLTYSRSRGLFAGISLEGSTLRPDNDANERLYGKKLEATDIVLKNMVPPPAGAKELLEILNQHSPRNQSDKNSH
jgi:SH3 domain-containing YSC84-like protein 1